MEKVYFPDSVEAFRQWIERNPLQQGEKDARKDGSPWKDGKKDILLSTKEHRRAGYATAHENMSI